MHELPLTKSIFKIVLRRAEAAGAVTVNRVVLEIGILREFIPEIVQKYWNYVAKGSIAAAARVEIRELDACIRCGGCGREYTVGKEQMQEICCPSCGCPTGTMIAGGELRIVGIEIVKDSPTEH